MSDVKFYELGDFQVGITYDRATDKGVIVLNLHSVESSMIGVIERSFEGIKNVWVRLDDDVAKGGHFYTRIMLPDVDVFNIETSIGVSNRQGAKELYALLKEYGATDTSES